MRIAFFGSAEFAVPSLEKLLFSQDYNITAIVTQPDRPAGRGKKLTATPVKNFINNYYKNNNINNIEIYQPEYLDLNFINFLKNLDLDLIIVIAYGLKIPQAILDLPKKGCINLHGSLLPKWRGAAPIQRAIEAGDKLTGVTTIKMDSGIDTGDILLSDKLLIDNTETTESLINKLKYLGAELLIKTLDNLNNIMPIKQSSYKHTEISYAKKIESNERWIDWRLSAQQIDAKIRAFFAKPIARTRYFNNINNAEIIINILESKVIKNYIKNNNYKFGEIIDINKDGLLIYTGEGEDYLLIKKIVLAGGKPVLASQQNLLNLFKINHLFY